MSFFNDFLSYFKVDNVSEHVVVSFILGVGANICGDVKIIELSASNIIMQVAKKIIEVTGENLTISSMSKGELFISGNVKAVGQSV